jgi:membrane protein
MLLRFRDIGKLLKTAFKKWIEHDPFKESSVIAYNAIFSLPGLMVVIITLAGYFFGREIVSSQMHRTIASAMGVDTADQVEGMVRYAMTHKESIWATILGTATILIGATGVFVQLQKSLNRIWQVEAKVEKSGLWTFIRIRLFSFGIILSIGFLLLISLFVSAILAAAGDWIRNSWDESYLWVFNILNFIVSLSIITLLFAMLYKIMPDAKVRWRLVWVGAIFTALLFTLGKTLLGFYFGKAEPGTGYGAAGSIVLILLWVSYSTMILFFGAECTKAYADLYYGSVPANEVADKKSKKVIKAEEIVDKKDTFA